MGKGRENMSNDQPSLTILLIRHAESVAPGISGLDEYTRPLTAKGMRDASQLRDRLASMRIDAAYSSPYLRARQTIEPIAQARGLSIGTVEDLRERLLSPVDLPDWRAHLKRSWEDFDYAPPGGETSREAQARVVRVLEMVAARHAGGIVILASHGNLIALALNAFMPSVDYTFWESIPMPAVFTLIRDGDRWRSADDGE
jgi:2,3-bisphosphoglycerate-dependent phosphoglycerate mutase